ncbi:MAG: MEDS domain-containing protein [Pseudonocardiaceae bacterium]
MRRHFSLTHSSCLTSSFSHDVLVHHNDDELITATQTFVEQGLASGGIVLVHGTRQRVALMHEVLGTHPQLEYGFDEDLYQMPTRTLFAYQRKLAHNPEPTEVWATGTVPFGCDPATQSGWARYESLLNEALIAYPWHGLCTYDTRTLPESVIEAAKATHPTISTGQTSSPNPQYHDPAAFLAHPLAQPPQPPHFPPSVVTTLTDVADLTPARHLIKTSARASSALPPQAIEEFLIAVNQVITNGLTHGASPVHLAHWAESTTLTCQVVDSGPGTLPPLTGYRHPNTSGHHNHDAWDPMGLWAARQLVDDLIITNTPHGSTSVLLTKT